ncbi:MAG TPA: SHOCT domain-containing protein [Stenomitos sp.]
MDGATGLGMALWGLLGALLVLGFGMVLMRLSRPVSPEFRANLPEEPTGARRLLDERFARGEIDEEEYRKRRQLLSD